MLERKWLFIPFILAALGIPYAIFDGGKFFAGGGKADPAGQFDLLSPDVTPPMNAAFTPTARLEGPAVKDLAEVIRFDISPRWVAQNWSRVSTVTAELELEGLRVPLVTGSLPDDLAGSLTYYFDKQHQLQRLTFHGTTGDERRLVSLLTRVYHFEQQPSLGGGMYATLWNGKPTSVLRISHSPVVMAAAPNARLEIMLEINRPSERYGLSRELSLLLEQDAHVRRW